MNTGWVGGGDADEGSKKVKIPVSSACVKGVAESTITWTKDPDFGYEVATEVPGIDDRELLQPYLLYERQGRSGEYADTVARLKRERAEFLSKFEGLGDPILAAVR
jgi:phosphoenolpyruvate carboxykinase (ATP)